MKSYFWVKVRHTWLDDDVIGTLPSDALKWRYLQLYLAAGDFNQGGALPPLPRLAYRLRMSAGDLAADLEALEGAGLLRQSGDIWQVVRFEDEQGRASDAERAELYRERQRKRAAGMLADVELDEDLDRDEELDEEIERDKINSDSSSRLRYRETTDIVTSCDDHDHDDDGPSLFSAYKDTRPPNTELSAHDKQVLLELSEQHGKDRVLAAIHDCAMSASGGRFNLSYLVARLEDPLPPKSKKQQGAGPCLRQIAPGVWA